ncbi:hypothetical protein V2V61_11100 [Streptococcus agalactiae]
MNDVGHDIPTSAIPDFPKLLDWNDIMEEEREDALGYARRATLALLTVDASALMKGFAADARPGLDAAIEIVVTFQQHLQRMKSLADTAQERLTQIRCVLAACGEGEE